jgi:hypothetical protein
VFCTALSGAKVTFPGHQLDQQEKLRIMVNSENDVSDARIRALENKMQDMEPLIKGLIEETLDLKSVFLTQMRVAEESSRQERIAMTVVMDTASPSPTVRNASLSVPSLSNGSAGIQVGDACQPDITAAVVEPAMVMIMQPDGTMKMEPRCGDRNQTSSTEGYGPTRMAHLSRANRSL